MRPGGSRKISWLVALAVPVFTLYAIATIRASSTNTLANSVIGQADFVHDTPNFVRPHSLAGVQGGIEYSALTVDRVNGRLYVADTNNNRVLGWASVSSFANGQGADIVIGQPDPFTTQCNVSNATPTALTDLCTPEGVASDPNGNLYVGDNGNVRVVFYSDPFKQSGRITGGYALSVPGVDNVAVDAAGDLFVTDLVGSYVYEYDAPVTSSSAATMTFGGPGTSTNNLANPGAVAIDGSGNVYIADGANSRVVEFNNAVATRNTTADHVWGQPNFTSKTSGAGTTGMFGPSGVAIDPNQNLWVVDKGNNRLLEFNTPATYSGTVPQPASLVVGQPNFTDIGCNQNAGLSDMTLCGPIAVSADASGNVYVLDLTNIRVVEYNQAANPPTNATANRELGQFDFVHSTYEFEDAQGLQTNKLNPVNSIGVAGIAVDTHSTPNHLYVVDTNNQRVLGYNDAASFATSAAADLVIGEPDFYSASCYLPNANVFCFTALGGAAVDSQGDLYVADAGENRVLEFPPPFEQPSGSPIGAVRVFGEPDFNTIDGCDGGADSNTTLCQPIGVALDAQDNLYIADSGNARVLEYPKPNSYTGSTPEPAAVVFGQRGSFTTNSCVLASSLTAQDMCYPTALAFDRAGDLYVADRLDFRVLEFNNPLANPSTPNTTADLIFGQGATGTNFTTGTCLVTPSATQSCGVAGVAIDSANTVYVSDSKYNRTLSYLEPSLPPTNVTPNLVLGQGAAGTSFTTRTCAFGDDGLCEVTGTAVDQNGNLYLSDKASNRVLRIDQPNGPVPTFSATPTATPTRTATPTPTATRTATPTATATPIQAKLEISPKTLNFGNKTAVGKVSKAKEVTIKNGSSKNSKIAVSIQNESTAAPFAVKSQCDTMLKPGKSCKVSVTFAPANTTAQSGKLMINDNEQGSPQTVSLSGTGATPKKKK